MKTEDRGKWGLGCNELAHTENARVVARLRAEVRPLARRHVADLELVREGQHEGRMRDERVQREVELAALCVEREVRHVHVALSW